MDLFETLDQLLGNERMTSTSGRKILGRGRPRSQAPGGRGGTKSQCPCCDGKGAFDTWARPCEPGHMHKKMDCPTCEGACFLVGAEDHTRCPKCGGKGGFDTWDKPCFACEMHFKLTCPTCNGKCFLAPAPVENTAGIGSRELLASLREAIAGDRVPRESDEVSEEERAKILVRAMVMAAKSDGRIDREEQARIFGGIGGERSARRRFVRDEFARQGDAVEFARSVPIGMEEEVYAISLTAIDLDSRSEAGYLRDLRGSLRLDPDDYDAIHRNLGVRVI